MMNKPVYQGDPLGSMVPMPNTPKGYPQLWIWSSFWYPEPASNRARYSPELVNALIAQGYQLVESKPVPETQLHRIVRLLDDQGKLHYYYRGKAFPPVVLAFSLPADREVRPIRLINPLPLPQLGEYGMVQADNRKMHIYSIFGLPLEARQRWSTLGEKLRALSSPLEWTEYSDFHFLAADEHRYQLLLHSFDQQYELTIGATREEILLNSLLLEDAHMRIADLHTALQKATWLEQWQEIQLLAQQLAQDYYQYHLQYQEVPQQQTGYRDKSAPVPTDTPPKQKRPGRPHPPTSIVAKGKEALAMKADSVTREIINGLRDKTTYILHQDQQVVEHRHLFQKEQGQITITISPLKHEGWETVLDALNTLGDGCIDTHIAALAIAIDRNGTDPQRLHTPFLVSPDDILDVCKKQKSNGSYTATQRAEVMKQLKTLSQARVIATMPRPGKKRGRRQEPTIIKVEGAIIELLSFKIAEYSTITGEELWEQCDIAIGRWASMIPELSPQIAIMLRQVLAYSAKNERYQKRLGVYLTFMFRINAKHGGSFPHDITMGALLEGAGIVPPRQQGEFREAIEKALERLKQDQVIGDYWKVVEATPQAERIDQEIQEHARGWFAAYLKQKWNFSPPEDTQKQYRKLLKGGK